MMSLWDALRMNMMISYQELVRTFPKTVNQAKHFSFKNLINYITGLIFCLSILITSAFLPVSIANFFGAPYEVGYLFSVLCLVLALLYLWMRAKNKN
ncbi:hypothetical protein OU545_21545 [Escherichia coli]|nr:hypothetical protein [Escherichia coli]